MKIVVADDSALLREGVAGLLTRRGHDIVGEACDAEELTSLIDATPLPDLLITDVRMPPNMRDDGLTTALELRERHPGLNVLVLSQYVAAPYARELFGQKFGGGTGYLLKDRVAEVADFITTCETVAGGGVVIDPEVASSLMHASAPWLRALTPRELEVLELMAEGLSNAEISAKLFLSSAAVAKHVSSIFSKLGLTPDEDNRRVRAILMFLSERGVE
ncbi:response regulator transcription factor [Corynebacterium hadale]|uniref:response regulator transcription factor n=1 Tax=Corynebacterium hadale TaxID=2026255 RepID=UPI000BAA4303|nr:response regulator transcription factor [Corynebacterium hadale]PAT12564.1 DNA-binding response regulator [Corynebacterium hadale]